MKSWILPNPNLVFFGHPTSEILSFFFSSRNFLIGVGKLCEISISHLISDSKNHSGNTYFPFLKNHIYDTNVIIMYHVYNYIFYIRGGNQSGISEFC